MNALLLAFTLQASLFPSFGHMIAESVEPADFSQMGITAADAEAIRALIEAQIEAFRQDDAETAFGYAAPAIQAQVGSPERFMQMVTSQYASVYRPQEVEFLDLQRIAGSLSQRVRLVGPQGERVLAVYTLEQQPDQSWRISGCTLVPTVRGTTAA